MYFWEVHGGGGIGWNSNFGAEGDTVSLCGSALLFPPRKPVIANAKVHIKIRDSVPAFFSPQGRVTH